MGPVGWRQLRVCVACAAVVAASVTVFRATDEARTPEVYLQLGDLLAVESRYREAAEAYRKARTAASDEDLKHRAHAGLVRVLLRTAEFSPAREEAETLVATDPGSVDAIALQADALWGVGLFPEAEQRYRDALSVDPHHARSHHGLSRVLTARRQFPDALAHIDLAIAAVPGDAEFHHTRSFICERLSRFDESAAALGRYQALLPPNDRDIRLPLARAQIRFLEAFRGRTPFGIEESVASAVHRVPFHLVRDKIVVQGRVNGGRTVDFVLDTGAEMTVLGRRSAERAGVLPLSFTLSAGVGESGLRGLQLGRIDEIEVGTFKMKNVPAIIKNPPLRGLPTREGESWSPLALGLSMKVDYEQRLVTFGRKLPQSGDNGGDRSGNITMPLYLYRLAMVRGRVNDREPASFIVDTGGEVISISTAMATALGPSHMRKIPLKVYGSSGWDRDAFLLPGLDLAFDRVRFENFATVVLNLRAPSVLLGFELGGIVGHRFLSRYVVGIDLERNVLSLEPTTRATAWLRGAPPGGAQPPGPSVARLPSPE